MKILVLDPEEGEIVEFEDTQNGKDEAISLVRRRLEEYHEDDVVVFRGEKMKFIPPSSNGDLVVTSS